jgi:tetratricopeptide (TPR) repeat protein
VTDTTWIPGLIVVTLGLAAGLYMGWKLRKQKAVDPAKEDPELGLAIRDLEARREDLYRRLRSADEDQISSDEKAALETAAARTLKELDRLEGLQPETSVKPSMVTAEVATEAQVSASNSHGRHPLLVGFASGALLMAVVGMLIYWANRDAKPKPDNMGGGTPVNMASESPHDEEGAMSPEVAARVTELQARVNSNPEDWMAKKELALTLMSGAQFVEAFELSEEILQNFPEDPDALLVQGVVRMTMGQSEIAINLLDRVLAQHPDHLQALLYRGLALYQSGQTERAIDSWEIGLQMAGGSHPDFEEVLAMASAQANQPTAGPSTPVQQSQPPPPQPVDREGYPVRIDLASGAMPQPGSTLFIFLRPESGGPPVAARRITSARFPLQFTLGPSDSMMGTELPKKGLLVAKLDSDGSASTTSELDLESQAIASWGEETVLTLEQ